MLNLLIFKIKCQSTTWNSDSSQRQHRNGRFNADYRRYTSTRRSKTGTGCRGGQTTKRSWGDNIGESQPLRMGVVSASLSYHRNR